MFGYRRPGPSGVFSRFLKAALSAEAGPTAAEWKQQQKMGTKKFDPPPDWCHRSKKFKSLNLLQIQNFSQCDPLSGNEIRVFDNLPLEVYNRLISLTLQSEKPFADVRLDTELYTVYCYQTSEAFIILCSPRWSRQRTDAVLQWVARHHLFFKLTVRTLTHF